MSIFVGAVIGGNDMTCIGIKMLCTDIHDWTVGEPRCLINLGLHQHIRALV